MKRSLSIVIMLSLVALLSGCIVTKTPNTNDVTIPAGAQVTFSVLVFPPTATFAWTLDGAPLSNTGNSYVYTAQGGGHFLIVRATHVFGTDTQAWYINSPVITFNKTYGGSSQDMVHAMQRTSDGGYILAGSTESFGAGGADAWLIKTDANGIKVWDKTFGGSSSDWASAVQQTSDGGYILAGSTESFGAGGDDAWLIKTDANGIKVWDKTFGGSNSDCAFTMQRTSDGGYILAGTFVVGGYPEEDAWLIKTDANGIKVWDKTFAGSGEDEAYAVQQTSDGGYILAGTSTVGGDPEQDAWLIKTNVNGNEVWETTFGVVGSGSDWARAVQQTSDGGYILAGWTDSFGAGANDAWLIKTDANGIKVWDKTFGGSNSDCAFTMQRTSDGGYILAGSTDSFGAGGADAWLIKTDANGIKVWDKTFGGSSSDWARAVQQTSDGGYILAGSTWSFGAGHGDAWLIKTDAEGNAPPTPTPG